MSSHDPGVAFTVAVVSCPRHPELFRWRIVSPDGPLDLVGYAYATRWMAERAGFVALQCHLAREREREGASQSRFSDRQPPA